MIDRSPGFETIIGLEVHAQMLTESKIFAGDASSFGAEPNTHISAITLGLPGTLPRLNKRAVELAVRMGLACGCDISRHQIFDRKNYFYPDLPKGYQITQDRTPVCRGGFIPIRLKSGEVKSIRLNRIHLEEDAGKSIHAEGHDETLLDFNRAGTALIEIVTEPVLTSPEEAGAVLAEIRKMVRYLGICDGNLEEGSLRCDANVSVRPQGSGVLGKKVEVKNMNSIRHVQRAIEVEATRQIELVLRGEDVVSETRLYDAAANTTRSMRIKEELNDYRYFPDPDLAPVVLSDDWLNAIRASMPALPEQVVSHLMEKYALPEYDARVLADDREVAMYFQSVCEHTPSFKSASNWLMGPVKSYLNEKGIEIGKFPLTPAQLAALVNLIEAGQVSYTAAAQKIFPAWVLQPEADPAQLANTLNLLQDSSADSLGPLVDQVIREFPLKVEEYHKGKKAIVTMFMGEVMKRSKGKADPRLTQELILQRLKKS
ncbi:MAG TPA: Asp-tRNA(Asn)/Glu-tRNA(Gln) amidotransferase GatCAB subunit B [Cytophagales bacterium]|nr:Asp-tRNA(Asn)/Glu-tRNA(Gln) amidotransferase GatCAB subunit B [Cytophagales bacterium]